jgi:hypothetical protein
MLCHVKSYNNEKNAEISCRNRLFAPHEKGEISVEIECMCQKIFREIEPLVRNPMELLCRKGIDRNFGELNTFNQITSIGKIAMGMNSIIF